MTVTEKIVYVGKDGIYTPYEHECGGECDDCGFCAYLEHLKEKGFEVRGND